MAIVRERKKQKTKTKTTYLELFSSSTTEPISTLSRMLSQRGGGFHAQSHSPSFCSKVQDAKTEHMTSHRIAITLRPCD